MRLNDIKPDAGARQVARRVGRGIGSGLGKTAGRGHKGQHARTGGFRKVGFEGGQMPLQRRLPKVGFRSHKALVTQEVRLGALSAVSGDVVDVGTLKAAGLIRKSTRFVKIMLKGTIDRAVTVRGVGVTKGAAAAILEAGGSIEAAPDEAAPGASEEQVDEAADAPAAAADTGVAE